MPKINLRAVQDFHQKVHVMNSSQQKELRLSSQEAKNLAAELSQLTALLVELQSDQTDYSVVIAGGGF